MPEKTIAEYVDNLRVRLIASRDIQNALSSLIEEGNELGFVEESRVMYLVTLSQRLTELAGYALYEAANLAPTAERIPVSADGEEAVIKEWRFDDAGEIIEE